MTRTTPKEGHSELCPATSASSWGLPPPLDAVNVYGYSERGAFNALLHEIAYADDAKELLRGLLNLVKTPGGASEHGAIDGAVVLPEPSLSDFGDADAVALLHGAGGRCAVFLEGKVKASHKASWTLQEEWNKFRAGVPVPHGLPSSNLFTQLYHKMRFVSALRCVGIPGLQWGVAFPPCSTKQMRKIGHNPVVLRATRLISTYLQRVQYVAVVPDTPQGAELFFRETLPGLSPDDLPGWDACRWGYLCWSEIECFCRRNGLANSVQVLEFNDGQIY